MQGFKEFIMRGNLVELATAFIMGVAFAAVVESFTEIIMNVIAKFGGQPDFTGIAIAGIDIGTFLTALSTFLITAAVIYFLVVAPYNRAKAHLTTVEDDATATSEELLTEIRDLLKSRQA